MAFKIYNESIKTEFLKILRHTARSNDVRGQDQAYIDRYVYTRIEWTRDKSLDAIESPIRCQ